jgi:hypothetical protein
MSAINGSNPFEGMEEVEIEGRPSPTRAPNTEDGDGERSTEDGPAKETKETVVVRKLAPRYIVATGLSLLTLKDAKATAIATINKVKEVLGDHHPTFRAKWLLASPTNLSERGPAIYTGTATIMITDTDEDHTEMKTLREHFYIYLPAPVQQTEWQVNYDSEASLPELLYEWSCFGGDGPVAILVNPARYEEKLRKQVRVYVDTDPPTALTRFSDYKRTEAGKAHTLKHWKVVLPAETQSGLSALSGAKLFAYSHGGNKGSRSELTTCELTGRVPFAVEGEDINQGSMATEFDDIPLAILDTLGALKLETPRAFRASEFRVFLMAAHARLCEIPELRTKIDAYIATTARRRIPQLTGDGINYNVRFFANDKTANPSAAAAASITSTSLTITSSLIASAVITQARSTRSAGRYGGRGCTWCTCGQQRGKGRGGQSSMHSTRRELCWQRQGGAPPGRQGHGPRRKAPR